ncbi:MAG: hypothetical protein ACRDHP_10735, partial [Ktedonobacterales bacterium]
GNPVAPWGAASASTEPARSPAGLPLTRYAPSPYGPPVDGDRTMTPVTLAEADAETRRAIGYRPVELPPPLPNRRRGRGRVVLVYLVVLAALLLASVALAQSGAGAGLRSLLSRNAPTAPIVATQTSAAPACQVNTVNSTAAGLIAHPQLTTGVRDAAKKDYRPINAVTTFSTSQTVYLTFEIATSQAGAVDANFCAPGMRALGRLTIPAKSAGRYAEFAMIPEAGNVGQATATISWNGAVAASLPFTIKQ